MNSSAATRGIASAAVEELPDARMRLPELFLLIHHNQPPW
jgi:hypothetical protein